MNRQQLLGQKGNYGCYLAAKEVTLVAAVVMYATDQAADRVTVDGTSAADRVTTVSTCAAEVVTAVSNCAAKVVHLLVPSQLMGESC